MAQLIAEATTSLQLTLAQLTTEAFTSVTLMVGVLTSVVAMMRGVWMSDEQTWAVVSAREMKESIRSTKFEPERESPSSKRPLLILRVC